MPDTEQYSLTDLLELLVSEHGDALRVMPGEPPVLVVRGEDNKIEGPAITPENAEQMFHEIADSRQVRAFRAAGNAEFVHTFRDTRFLVKASLNDGIIQLELKTVN